jgi:hypothetical protein
LATHLIEWLPDFALKYSERESLGSHNAVRLIARAALAVYSSPRYEKRGEIGELLLHVALRQVFQTLPAISKFYFKDSSNNTVKGFDAVHVVDRPDSLQLWLGEVKFYADVHSAIHDVVEEVKRHTQRDYLRAEFATIVNLIDDRWPHANRLRQLLDKNSSLDQIFDQVCIPVFLTYESSTIAGHKAVNAAFEAAFIAEVQHHHDEFKQQTSSIPIALHLFLLPMHGKAALQREFDERLKAWQKFST